MGFFDRLFKRRTTGPSAGGNLREGAEVTVEIFNPTARIDQMAGDPSAKVLRTESWIVGQDVSVEKCTECFHAASSKLYAIVDVNKPKPVVVAKLTFDTMIETTRNMYPGLM